MYDDDDDDDEEHDEDDEGGNGNNGDNGDGGDGVTFDDGFYVDKKKLQEMQKRAHNYCFIANTLADSVMININS